jgi:6-phosphofructokinase 2
VSGSLPLGIPFSIYAEIACIAKSKQAKLIVDTSGEALKHAVKAGVFLIKPSLGELAMLAGVEKIHVDQVTDIARNIIRQGNCEVIMVSMGAAGAMLVTNDQA